LIVLGDGDDDSALDNTKTDDVREDVTSTDSENVAAGFQYFLQRSAKTNTSVTTGLRLSGTEPVGVLGGRYRLRGQWDSWRVSFIQRLQWLTNNGFVIPTQLEFDRPVTETLLFRNTYQGTWFEAKDGYFYDATFALRQRLSPGKAMIYESRSQFQTEPFHQLKQTRLRVQYRQTLWRDWITFDISPQLSFPRNRDFQATPGIFAGIETSFGG
jgi:hypothetical protein